MNKNVFYSVVAVLLAIALYLFIQLRNAEKEVKDLEFSIQVTIDGRAVELKAEREIAEVKVKEIQVVIDSIYRADSIEDIKFKKTSLYYERKIKELKSITTVMGVDHIRDSILRANGLREAKR